MAQRLRPILLAALALALLVGLAFAVRSWLGRELEPKVALERLRSVQGEWWAAPGFVIAYVIGTTLLLPATLFHMVAGAAWGFWPALAINFVAVNTVSSIHFLAARRLGGARVSRLLERYDLSIFRREAALEHGFRAMVFVRLLPLPFVAVNAAAGLSPMRWRDFFFGSMVGAFPVLCAYTWFASSLVEGVAGAQREALWRAGAAGLCIFLATFLPRLWNRLRRNRVAPPP